jgi:hypothetical protein
MVASIEEIIRVLQLTTTIEEDKKKAGESMDAYLRGMAEVFHQAQEALASGGELLMHQGSALQELYV